ncbi:hypothetical protein NADFUDRAFT_50223 [Nadsonia fulvescens var. elongata DSM 6958]|uniref:ATP-dependent RNA helicase n=1 Tax=Nadsonia fulvescens var. elongata DSM 6958 TaxID=857566 RepID=A0A1E3PM83_9ASCO|nr:hypothetical protein NADFUDRAFT_50223 [Nadsonia fulvescens var. elongata DSM 6958]
MNSPIYRLLPVSFRAPGANASTVQRLSRSLARFSTSRSVTISSSPANQGKHTCSEAKQNKRLRSATLENTRIELKIDPRKVKTFGELNIKPPILESISKNFKDIEKPTNIQKGILALLRSDASLVVRQTPGTGVSTALSMYALDFGKGVVPCPTPFVTTIILVHSKELALQYSTTFKKLLKDATSVDKNSIYQTLYRSTPEEESAQLTLLKSNPGPNILITTPTRLLDLLENDETRRFVPIYNTSNLVVDEADLLISTKSSISTAKSDTSNNAHESPGIILMQFLIRLRNRIVRENNKKFIPLRLIITSSALQHDIPIMLHNNGWDKDRPLIKVGMDPSGGRFTSRFPADVSCHCVTYQTDSLGSRVIDTKLPTIDKDWLFNPQNELLLSMEESSHAFNRSKKISAMKGSKNNQKSSILFSECSTFESDYFDAFQILFEQDKRTPSLVIIPDHVSMNGAIKALAKRNIKVGVLDSSEDSSELIVKYIHQTQSPVSRKRHFLAMDEVFNTKYNNTEDISYSSYPQPDIVLSKYANIRGIDMPSLSRVYALGFDSLPGGRSIFTMASRCRVSNIFDRRNKSLNELLDKNLGPEKKGKLIIVSIDQDFGNEVSKALAISLAKIGVNVTPLMK